MGPILQVGKYIMPFVVNYSPLKKTMKLGIHKSIPLTEAIDFFLLTDVKYPFLSF